MVKKLRGPWQLTIVCRRLNATITPVTTAVPNFVELAMQIQGVSYSQKAKLDVKYVIYDSTLGTPQGLIHAHQEGSVVYL